MNPVHQHDCSNCRFVGTDFPQPGEPRCNQVDVYYCDHPSDRTIVRRYGSEGSNYGSCSRLDCAGKWPSRYARVANFPTTTGE